MVCVTTFAIRIPINASSELAVSNVLALVPTFQALAFSKS